LHNRRKFLKVASAGVASAAGVGLLPSWARAYFNFIPTVSLSFSAPTNIYDYNGLPGYKGHVGANNDKPYGSWADGPLNPYRRSSSDIIWAVVPHSENRTMYLVPGRVTTRLKQRGSKD